MRPLFLFCFFALFLANSPLSALSYSDGEDDISGLSISAQSWIYEQATPMKKIRRISRRREELRTIFKTINAISSEITKRSIDGAKKFFKEKNRNPIRLPFDS